MSSPNYPVLCCPLPYRVAPKDWWTGLWISLCEGGERSEGREEWQGGEGGREGGVRAKLGFPPSLQPSLTASYTFLNFIIMLRKCNNVQSIN